MSGGRMPNGKQEMNDSTIIAELRRLLKLGGTLIVSSSLAPPRIRAFIRVHAAEAGWFRTIPLLARQAALVMFDLLIISRGNVGKYDFMDKRAVQKLLACEAVTDAYANQNWFACTIKE